jgi:tRNA-specific 2-thiouridylase
MTLVTEADFQLEAPFSARRIVVAMSGGVDSSVVAALAARTGAEVIGITLQLYDHGAAVKRAGSCCAGQDIRDARAVCGPDRHRPLCVRSMKARFRDSVIADFADEYMAGRTPIPCVKCNMGVKFTDLFRAGARIWARTASPPAIMCAAVGRGRRAQLHRAADPARDQSYFLFATTQDQLDYLRFPLGGLPKGQVREIAAEWACRSRDEARQSGHLLRTRWRLCLGGPQGAPRC